MELVDIRLDDAVVSVPQEWIDRCDTLRSIQTDFGGQELYIPVTVRDMLTYIEHSHTPGSMYKLDGKWKIVTNGYLDSKPSPNVLRLADRLGDRWFLDTVSLQYSRVVAELGIYCLGTRLLNLAESAEFWSEQTHRVTLPKSMRFPSRVVCGRFADSNYVYAIARSSDERSMSIYRLGGSSLVYKELYAPPSVESTKYISIDVRTNCVYLKYTDTVSDDDDETNAGFVRKFWTFGETRPHPFRGEDDIVYELDTGYTVRGQNVYKDDKLVLPIRGHVVYVDDFKLIVLKRMTLTAYYYRHQAYQVRQRPLDPDSLFKLKTLQLGGRIVGCGASGIVTVIGEDMPSQTVTHYRFLPTEWSGQ